MIESLQCGRDVTDKCFDECLQIAVQNNLHFSAGFIILRTPSNMEECFHMAISKREENNKEVIAMLLLCLAAYDGDADVLHILCQPDYRYKQEVGNVENILLRSW